MRYCPIENIRAIPVKRMTPEVGEPRPPIKAETLTIDVSTINRITRKEIKMKIPLDPSILCI